MSRRAVECECGAILPVPEEARGPLSCSCGRRVVVPLPEEFDGRSVLISATTVERRVRRMIAVGELPSTRECACCGSMNAEALDLRLVCEVERSRVTGGFRFLIIPGLFWMTWEEEERIETLGRENTVPVPVQVCGACAEGLKEPAASRWAYLFAAVAAVVPAAVVWPSSAPLGVLSGVFAFLVFLAGIA